MADLIDVLEANVGFQIAGLGEQVISGPCWISKLLPPEIGMP